MADPSRTASVGDGLDGLKRVGLPASAHQRHEVSPTYARIDGKRVDSKVWLEAGRHTVSVSGNGQRVIVRDAGYQDRINLPPEPEDWRFFGRYGYDF